MFTPCSHLNYHAQTQKIYSPLPMDGLYNILIEGGLLAQYLTYMGG